MSHAQIKDGIVWNVIVASDEWAAEHQGEEGFSYVKYVDDDGFSLVYPSPYPGCQYDEATGVFLPPVNDESEFVPELPPIPEDDAEIEEELSDILGF